MKNTTIVLVGIGLCIAYIFIINIISGIDFNTFSSENQSQIPEGCTMINNSYYSCPSGESGFTQKIGFGDQISVQIERHRWYGIIYDNSKDKTLYLFGLVKVPLKSFGTDYIIIHIFFLIILFIIISIMLLAKQKDLNRIYPI